jgi:hypothetical protein
VPAYFQARSDMWSKLMLTAAQGSLKGHEAYASAQAHAWQELSRSSIVALSPITDAPIRSYPIKSILL